MSGQLIGGVIGAVIGFFTPIGPVAGYAIGSAIGGIVAPGSSPTQYGPRLEDLRPQASEYGKPIPIVYGTVGMGGNVIWASDYVEKEVATDSGGKGGPSQTTVQYEYFGNFAVMFAEGPSSIGRIWAGPGKRLIYDGVLLEGGGSIRIYDGSESQLPDPLIESYLGAGNVPAYRGVCYVVFEMFPLAKDGNALPFLTAEVGAKAGAHGQTPTYVSTTLPTPNFTPANAAVEPTTGWIWQASAAGSAVNVRVISDKAKTVIADFTVPSGFPGDVSVKNIVVTSGAVFVLAQPYVFDSRLALVGVFGSGVMAPDGTALEMPTAPPKLTSYGSPTTGIAGDPIDPQSIFVNSYEIWIGYAFTNASTASFGIFPLGAQSPATYTKISPNLVIGTPFQMLGDDQYTGAAGSLGGDNPNFLIFSGHALLHTLSVAHPNEGKAFDYDPKRKVFITYTPFSLGWTAIDAATGVVTQRTLTLAPGDTTPIPAGLATAITYSSKTDRYLIGSSSNQTGSGTTLYIVNPDTGLTEGTYTFEAGGQMINPLLDPAQTTGAPYVLSFDQGNVKRLFLGGLATPTPIGLGLIVADLSERAGLTADQYDVAALTDMVDGYAIARQTTVRGSIDALRPAYYFDAVESGGLVKYVKRGGESIAVIQDDDLAARDAGSEPGDPLLTTRQMEVELPNVMNVNYLSAATDYEKATKLSKRLIGSSREESTLDLPLVLSDTKGQEIAEVNLHVPWVQRLAYEFALPRKYSYLEPTDIVTVKGYDMIVTKITATPGGLLKCEGVATDSSHYVPHVVVTETPPNEKLVFVPGQTVLELM